MAPSWVFEHCFGPSGRESERSNLQISNDRGLPGPGGGGGGLLKFRVDRCIT